MMKKQNTIYLGIGIVVIILIAAIAIFSTPKSEETTSKVGAIMGFTGAGSFYSKDVKQGMDLALEEINKEGESFEIIYEDSKTDAKEAVTAYNKLKNINNVDAMISLFSVTSVPLVPLANEDKMPLIVSITSAEDIGKNPYVLQYYLKAEDYAYPIAESVIKEGFDKVAIMHSQEDFGKSVSDKFTEKFNSLGGKVVIVEPFNMYETDYNTQLLKIKESGAQAIIFAGFKPHYVNALKQLTEMNIKLPFFEMSPNTMYPAILKETGKSSENVTAVSLDFPITKNSVFTKKYKEKYGKEPSVAASLGYDMVKLISKAKEKNTSDNLVDQIISLKQYNGLNGLVEISNEGECNFPLNIVRVIDGKIEKIQ